MIKKILFLLAATFLATSVFAHYVPDNEYAITNTTVLPFVDETKGPVRAPAAPHSGRHAIAAGLILN